MFPSPLAVERLDKSGRRLHFAFNMEKLREELLPLKLRDSNALPEHLFLGKGGNGIIFEFDLRGHKYAVKWVSAESKVFSVFSSHIV